MAPSQGKLHLRVWRRRWYNLVSDYAVRRCLYTARYRGSLFVIVGLVLSACVSILAGQMLPVGHLAPDLLSKAWMVLSRSPRYEIAWWC